MCNCIDKSEYLLLSHFSNNYWLRLFIVFQCAAFDSKSHIVLSRWTERNETICEREKKEQKTKNITHRWFDVALRARVCIVYFCHFFCGVLYYLCTIADQNEHICVSIYDEKIIVGFYCRSRRFCFVSYVCSFFLFFSFNFLCSHSGFRRSTDEIMESLSIKSLMPTINLWSIIANNNNAFDRRNNIVLTAWMSTMTATTAAATPSAHCSVHTKQHIHLKVISSLSMANRSSSFFVWFFFRLFYFILFYFLRFLSRYHKN